ncbi:PLP-dependent aminotransferase family protein [Nocardia cyriacigeorgica]|uniref:PLP-dependent aminotransferase family protein n=1 Tax=Nocardia cyriacigeorgica TaxID=135487 RepID=A0ABX0CS72_9NOCA|nr:PLP-dependent aminotransferase family protein [Nocardia cyriacigeorgica]NEW41342.1 PLP-dependent aminotransferase family protein [Nocardia cyriacigeorgica]NEW52864.1 PLP-dependent aminotransferase family protein [Nocardia cyriacigeorgica]NEW57411.1 PLP-dependent aminotransferase family protein [Nocardia cyriacigeorgica]
MSEVIAELLDLDRASATPLSVQLADGLRRAATSGALRGGDRLPSSRSLAEQLAVSRTVVAAAYDQLHAEGWLDGRRGSGTYLTAAPLPGHQGATAATPPTEPTALLDLGPGAPCVPAIDRPAWRRAWRAAADRDPAVRKDRRGEPQYLAAVTEHLLRHRGLSAGGGTAILATSGTSAAVNEIACAVLRPGDSVAMEDPGYQRAVGAFRAAGVQVVPAPVDDEGLRLDALPGGIKAVYCTPAHQFPLGERMTAARRVRLVDYARANDVLLIEDDYDGELRYDTAPLPLLAAMAPDVVVHLGTTSKILSPTLGAGWLVAAPEIADAVLAYRAQIGSSPSPAGQLVLAELAAYGDLARHLRRLRRIMPTRRAFVVDQLRRRGLTIRGDDAGSHLVVPLPTVDAEHHAVAAARRRRVALDGLSRHHIGPQRAFGVALGYSALLDADFTTAVPIAAECLASALR